MFIFLFFSIPVVLEAETVLIFSEIPDVFPRRIAEALSPFEIRKDGWKTINT